MGDTRNLIRETVSVQELAELLGLSPRRVQQLVADGVIPKAAHGSYDLGRSIRAYLKHLKGDGLASVPKDYTAERTRLVKAQADKAEMEVALQRGDLWNKDDVAAIWSDEILRCRSRLLVIPSKVAPVLAAISIPAEVQDVLKCEIYQALSELANHEAESG